MSLLGPMESNQQPLAAGNAEESFDASPTTENMPDDIKNDPKMQQMVKDSNILVMQSVKAIHSPQTRDSILSSLNQKVEPKQLLSDMVVQIIENMEMKAAKQGKEFDDAVLLHGANVILAELTTVAEAAGKFKLTDQEKSQTLSAAISTYLKHGVDRGQIQPEKLKQLVGNAGQPQEATASQPSAMGNQMNGQSRGLMDA